MSLNEDKLRRDDVLRAQQYADHNNNPDHHAHLVAASASGAKIAFNANHRLQFRNNFLITFLETEHGDIARHRELRSISWYNHTHGAIQTKWQRMEFRFCAKNGEITGRFVYEMLIRTGLFQTMHAN